MSDPTEEEIVEIGVVFNETALALWLRKNGITSMEARQKVGKNCVVKTYGGTSSTNGTTVGFIEGEIKEIAVTLLASEVMHALLRRSRQNTVPSTELKLTWETGQSAKFEVMQDVVVSKCVSMLITNLGQF